MLAAGFLASPLLTQTKDIQEIYANGAAKRPRALSIEILPGQAKQWRPKILCRIYKIETAFAVPGWGLPAPAIHPEAGLRFGGPSGKSRKQFSILRICRFHLGMSIWLS